VKYDRVINPRSEVTISPKRRNGQVDKNCGWPKGSSVFSFYLENKNGGRKRKGGMDLNSFEIGRNWFNCWVLRPDGELNS